MATHRLPINDARFKALKAYLLQVILRDYDNDFLREINFFYELCRQVEVNNYCLNLNQVKELIEIEFNINDVAVDDDGHKYIICDDWERSFHVYYTRNVWDTYELDESMPFGKNYRFFVTEG